MVASKSNTARKSASLKVVSANEAATAELEPMSWDTTGELYVLNPKASRGDVLSQLQARLSQLSAMLTVVSGNGFESFSRWRGVIQGAYLWACSMLAEECKALAEVDHD